MVFCRKSAEKQIENALSLLKFKFRMLTITLFEFRKLLTLRKGRQTWLESNPKLHNSKKGIPCMWEVYKMKEANE